MHVSEDLANLDAAKTINTLMLQADTAKLGLKLADAEKFVASCRCVVVAVRVLVSMVCVCVCECDHPCVP